MNTLSRQRYPSHRKEKERFSQRNKAEEFITARPDSQEMLKGVFSSLKQNAVNL